MSLKRAIPAVLFLLLLAGSVPAVRYVKRIGQFHNPQFAVMTDQEAAEKWESLERADERHRLRYWNHDLTFLSREMARRHKDLYHTVTEEEFREKIGDLRSRIPAASNQDMYLGIKELIALIGDGHTRVFPPADMDRLILGLREFEEGIFVASCLPSHRTLLGTRLLDMGGIEADSLRKALSPLISHDNPVDLGLRSLGAFSYADYLRYAGVSGTDGFFPLRTEGEDGLIIEDKLARMDGSELSSIREVLSLGDKYPLTEGLVEYSHPGEWYWYEYYPGENLVYFQYDRCRDQKNPPLDDFLTGLTAFLEEKKDERLLVDLRYNGGGSSPLLDPFIRSIARNPGTLGEGGLYVAVGRHTYSSAVLNALSLKEETGALVIGEATGGGASHYGEVRSFNLPRSGIRIFYSTKYFRRPGGDEPISPDIPLTYSFADFKEGKDPVLEYLINR